jgi:hypothetical protein
MAGTASGSHTGVVLLLVPADPLRPRRADEHFAAEAAAARDAGITVAFIDHDALAGPGGAGRAVARFPDAGAAAVYRGWMLRAGQYAALSDAGIAQTAEQAGAQAVIQRQDRRRLDSAAGHRRGGVGEQHPAGLQRAEQRPHRRQGQQPGRAGQRGKGGGYVVGGDLPQRLIPCGPVGQRALQDAHLSLNGAGLPGSPGAGTAALEGLGPGAHVGRERRGQGGEPGCQPVLEDGLRVAAGQALIGEELHGPQRDQVPLDQEPPDIRSVPRWPAEPARQTRMTV